MATVAVKSRIVSIGIFQFNALLLNFQTHQVLVQIGFSLQKLAILFVVFVSGIGALKAQAQHLSVGVGATPMALSGDYRALGWNPAHLTFSPMNSAWKSAICGLEGAISVNSTVLEREDLWDDLLNRGMSNESWTGLTPGEWVNRLANEEIRVDFNLMTTGTAKHWKSWAGAYASRNVFFAESYLNPSVTSLLVEGGASSLFEFTIIGTDTLLNQGGWSVEDLGNVIGGLNSNGQTLLSTIFQDSKLGMSWHRTHELGVSKQWNTARGWSIHTGAGGRFLLGNGYFNLTQTNGQLDAFGAFSNGFKIEQLDSLNFNNPTISQIRNWGPVGQGWGADLGLVIAFSDKVWASASITDLGWMEWRGERYSFDDALTNAWELGTSNPNEWIDMMQLAMNPGTWFSNGVSETRRINNGVGFHVGGGLRIGQELTLAGDASFDNPELIGNSGTRFGLSCVFRPLKWLKFESGIRKVGSETIRVPAGFVLNTGHRGFEIGLQASDIIGIWRKTQSELGARFCFFRWVW
mgnify:CR=1 FL=1|tara:strand:+ start:5726 stop:7288 length:1563 start_codon:yes stop_codon:yes gene_type:complete